MSPRREERFAPMKLTMFFSFSPLKMKVRMTLVTVVGILLCVACALRNRALAQSQLPANASPQDLTLIGTVTKIYPFASPVARGRWAVRIHVDRVVAGTFSGATFTFTVHSPARAGLRVGRAYSIQATWTIEGYVVDELTLQQVRPHRNVDCRKVGEYKFDVVGNANRKKDSDSAIPEDLNIVVGTEVISKIELPAESEAKNFQLDSVKATRTGFEVNVDWGGDVNHYQLQFNFRCKAHDFYLYRVKNESFTTAPDSSNFLDKKETKEIRVEPNLPIEKFVMTDYLRFPGRRRRPTTR